MAWDIRALDVLLGEWIKQKDLPGVSVAAWGPDGEVFARGYGRANEDGTRLCDADTVHGIASMSKSQTALACAILETEGQLSFDDPVYRYFPKFSIPGAARDAVTLRHLAMHTAGIPPIAPLEWSIAMHAQRETEWSKKLQASAPSAFDTIDEIIDYIAHTPFPTLGAPGEIMSYCNEGYALLSYVVDQAAGMPLERFLQERVYGPLGMTRTILDVDASEARVMADGNITSLFEKEDGPLTCDDDWSVLPPYRGCGLVKSTARDMAAYYRCLSNYGIHEGKQVLPRAAIEAMIGIGFPAPRTPYYALGLSKRAHAGHIICEHSGGLHGVTSHGGFLLGEGWGFAALCNLGEADVERLVWPMYNLAMGMPLETSLRWMNPVGHSFSDPEMVVGSYRSHEGIPVDVTVYVDNGRLMATRDKETHALEYCGGTLFAAFDADGEDKIRIEALIRQGQAWAVRVGTRVYQRLA